jgi:hypothetical protein
MERVYRAFDFMYTPHRIITQTVGEAVACGLPVIAPHGNKVASQTIDITDPAQLVWAIETRKQAKNNKMWTLKEFGACMAKIYKEACKHE